MSSLSVNATLGAKKPFLLPTANSLTLSSRIADGSGEMVPIPILPLESIVKSSFCSAAVGAPVVLLLPSAST
ncbi:hypothetical protein GGR32_000196 [Mesonia hippocampi]|uniref:Uncharacterized protein n=1 Tax=Mesonia hippocampi TaxID=1628250 RepID=A0A840EV10_9FLAO|nr:hypothetical protein [Mesonia hippocampi]MBB4117924.1 hypothetical protein [Mesonia hippocampi]